MNFYLVLGSFFLIYGIIGLIAYMIKNEKLFSKKEKLKEVYGEKGGAIFHFTKYVMGPIILGSIMLATELL